MLMSLITLLWSISFSTMQYLFYVPPHINVQSVLFSILNYSDFFISAFYQETIFQ